MNKLPLESQIESVLFFKGEPISKKKLAELLEKSSDEIAEALSILRQNLENRGVILIEEGDSVALGTSALASEIIEKVTKEELMRDLGKAGLETLSIILYRKEISKREVDYIRGVNSSFIIRNLLIRGLVERVEKDGMRGFSYKPTVDLLAHLGISRIEDLPEYTKVMDELALLLKKDDSTDTEQ